MLRVPVNTTNMVEWVRRVGGTINALIDQRRKPFLMELAFPPSPSEGDTVYRTDLHKVYTYDGTTWQAHW